MVGRSVSLAVVIGVSLVVPLSSRPVSAADGPASVREPIEFLTTPKGLPAEALEARDLNWSPDGKRVAVGYGKWTTTGMVRVFDSQTKEILVDFELPRGVASVAWSTDGRWLAASSWDNHIRVWDGATFKKARQFRVGSRVARIAFSPDSKQLATATEASELQLWDTTTWKESHKFTGELFRFQHVAFSPDGSSLCAAGGAFDGERFGRATIFDVASGKQQQVMNAGNAPLGCSAFSPDGRLIAAGSFDRNLYVWDVASGRQQYVLTDATTGGGVTERVSFSKDGELLASSGTDGSIRLWSTERGTLITRLPAPAGIMSVAFDPSGNQLAGGGVDSIVRVWDVDERKELFTLQPKVDTADTASEVLALAVSPDGRWLATAHEDATVRLRKADGGAVVRVLAGHSDVVSGLAFSPDSSLLATASYDRLVKLWPVESSEEPRVLKGHTNWVFAAAFSPDGKQLATSGYDKTIRLWNVADAKELAVLSGHTATVRSIAFAPDGKRLASGSADRTVRLWDLAKRESLRELKGHEGAVRAVAFAPDGQTIASGSEDHSIRLWNAADGQELRQLSGHTNMVWCLTFSPGGTTLASGGFDNSVRIWNPATGAMLQELKGHSDVVTTLAYAASSGSLLTGSYDKTLKLWTGKEPPLVALASLQTATENGVRFAFPTPDGQTLVTGNVTRQVKFWDLKTGQLTDTLMQKRGISNGVMSPDGALLATSGFGSQIYLWDVPGRKLLAEIETGHTESRAIAISPDGRKVAAGSIDGVITIWDVATREKLHELTKLELPIEGLAFSPDSGMLASASGNWKEWRKPGQVKLWDALSGREIAELPGAKSKMRRVCFTDDGKTLLACGSQPEILVYDVEKLALDTTIPAANEVTDLALLPDQRTIAAGLFTGVVALYDLPGRRLITEFDGHRQSKEKYVFDVAVSADGTVIATAGGDGHARFWPTARSGAKSESSTTLAEIIRRWPPMTANAETASEAKVTEKPVKSENGSR